MARTKEEIRACNRKAALTYWKKHKPEAARRRRLWADKHYFSGNRPLVLERDDWKCQSCGCTDEQSMLEIKRHLVVHHIDGNGRASSSPNNEMSNLITLCTPCHFYGHKVEFFKRRLTERKEKMEVSKI